MNAEQLIKESEGLTNEDIEENQLLAHNNLTKCIKEVKQNGRTKN
jgi:hypothetical protein